MLEEEETRFNKMISRRSFLAISAAAAASMVIGGKRTGAYAAKMGPKKNYPTVIIGAGLGGLCCGAYLARIGIPVTVVEQLGRPGGYAYAFDRADGKFTFDVSLHGTAVRENAAARILDDLGVLRGMNLMELPEVYHLRTPQLSIAIPQRDPGRYIELLSRHFPSEKKGIKGFVKEVVSIAEEGDKLHRKGMCAEILFPFKSNML